MALTFTYQMSGCVVVMSQFVPGITTSSEVKEAVSGEPTQMVVTQDGEIAVYNTLQVVNVKQPPPQATISITQLGEGFIARLVRVSQVAFEKALEDQRGVAMGFNLNATVEHTRKIAKNLVFELLNPKLTEFRSKSISPLTGAGLKLVYDKKPWTATVSIEIDPNNDKQLACAANFNFNRPTKSDVKHVKQADALRTWFERTVNEIVGGDSNA